MSEHAPKPAFPDEPPEPPCKILEEYVAPDRIGMHVWLDRSADAAIPNGVVMHACVRRDAPGQKKYAISVVFKSDGIYRAQYAETVRQLADVLAETSYMYDDPEWQRERERHWRQKERMLSERSVI